MFKIDNYKKSPFWDCLYNNSSLSKLLHLASRYFYFLPKYKFGALKEYVSALPRAMGFKDKRYLPLRALKNKYKGKRCFITCTGPSLTINDLELLRNEYVFGMNSICLIHDKTDWKPDFFGIQDWFVYQKIREKIISTDNGLVFAPLAWDKNNEKTKNWVRFNCCGEYHGYEFRFDTRYFARYSSNAYAKVYDGYSITHTLIQIATYLGFDEIYLLGADCSYGKDKHHFIETGRYDSRLDTITRRFFTAYEVAKKYANKHGIKIINCTRGGMLEIFPRMNLEDVIAINEKNKLQ